MPARTNAEKNAAIRRLADEFGATVLITIPERRPMSRVERAKRRTGLPHGGYTGGWSFPRGLEPSDFVFVIDWPYGPESNEWRTTTAKLLRQSIQRAGIDRSRCTFVSLTREPQLQADDIPTVDPRITEVVRAADTRYVILVGSHVQRVWHPDLTLEQAVGRTGIWHEWFVTAIHHPNAVLREIVHQRDWWAELAGFVQKIEDSFDGDPLNWVCALKECGQDADIFDVYGVGWCRQHVDTIRKIADRRPRAQPQPTLEES